MMKMTSVGAVFCRLTAVCCCTGTICFGGASPAADVAGNISMAGGATGAADFQAPQRLLPNDPGFVFGLTWNLDGTSQNSGGADFDIDAPEGWALQKDSPDIIVAVLDSGVRYTHEDLADNMWVNPGETPGNGIDDDQDGYIDDLHGVNALDGHGDPMDNYHHGTFVAGIIGALGNNGRGGLGVDWKVKIMACKMLDSSGVGTEEATVRAIDYARLHGAHIINASWNYPDYSEPIRAAIERAREAGILFITSAGNTGTDIDLTPSYPASYVLDNMIVVTAIDSAGRLPVDASFGAKTVHLAAPGSTIYAPWHSSDTAYAYANGTSMAAPHVTGICALLKAHYPAENHRQIIRRLLASAKSLPSLSGKCQTGGIASLAGAINEPSQTGDNSLRLEMAPPQSGGGLILNIHGSPGVQFEIQASTNLTHWEPSFAGRIPGTGSYFHTNATLDPDSRRYYRGALLPP